MQYIVGFLFPPSLDKVVLVRKCKPAWQNGRLNGVGGAIERGETPHQAMSREFGEEVKLGQAGQPYLIPPDSWHMFCSLVVASGDKIDFLYAVDSEATKAHSNTVEPIVVKEVSGLTVPDCLWSVPWLISMALTFISGAQKKSFMIIEKWDTEEQKNFEKGTSGI